MQSETNDMKTISKDFQEELKRQNTDSDKKDLSDKKNSDKPDPEKDSENDSEKFEKEDTSEHSDTAITEVSESEFEIPQDVHDLLEEISSGKPEGIDINLGEDDEAISLMIDLEAEMEKRTGNDYNKCLSWGKMILQKYSKNLNVAVWLTISWFRVEKLSGLTKGLFCLAELLNKYGEKCFPNSKEKQARVFNSLNNDPRLLILKKINFEEEVPVFTVTSEILDGARAKEALPRELLFRMTRFKGRSFNGEKKFLDDLKNELFPKDEKKSKLIDQNKEKLLTIFREMKTDEEPTIFSITDRFITISRSINGFKEYEDLFSNFKNQQYTSSERFTDELKQRFIDENADPNIINLHQQLINCIANNTIAYLLDLKESYEYFEESLKSYFIENMPEISTISELIVNLTSEAEKIVTQAIKIAQKNIEAQKPINQAPLVQSDKTSEQTTTSETIPVDKTEKTTSVITKAERKDQGQLETNAQNLKINREAEAIIAIKKALIYYFCEEKIITDENGKTRKEKLLRITADPRIYGMSRSLRWNNIKMLPNDNSVIGPDEIKQKYIWSKLDEGDFDTVIADFEMNFIENEQLQFWIDGQYFVIRALEQKGKDWEPCVQEIKFQLAKLLSHLPDLPKLTFRDKKTQYAKSETQKWIETDIIKILGGKNSSEIILPPLMGEDYISINKEFETACKQPLEKFEENARSMQGAIEGDLRVKGKFLRKLCLANYCYWANKYDLAHVLFDELIQQIEQYHIIEWEKTLCVSVWQSMYKNNIKTLELNDESEQQSIIKNQNKELIKNISKYDVVLALNLTKQEGE